jgi:hypothetical protein
MEMTTVSDHLVDDGPDVAPSDIPCRDIEIGVGKRALALGKRQKRFLTVDYGQTQPVTLRPAGCGMSMGETLIQGRSD